MAHVTVMIHAYCLCAVTTFLAFLACDTTFGVVNYRELFSPVAGWVHHIVYAFFFAGCLVGGGAYGLTPHCHSR